MTTAFLLKSSGLAAGNRGVVRRRAHPGHGLLMKGCVATAFLFVALIVLGVL